MAKQALPTHTISVYLLRAPIKSAKEALQEDPDKLEQHRITALGDDATLYVRRRPPLPPKWTEFFAGEVEPTLELKQASYSAVLLVKASGRLFAITFGSGGRFMLALGVYERNFGLRVAANSVEPDQIRSVSSRTFVDTALQVQRQVAEVSDIAGLQMDVQRDLLTRLEGSVRRDALGKRMSGGDSVRLTDSIRPRRLKKVCSGLLRMHRKEVYKSRYPWLDWMGEVTDQDEEAKLEEEVLGRLLNGEFDRFDVYPPEMVNADIVDFRTRRKTVVMEPTRALLIKTVERIGAKDPAALGEALKTHHISALNENGEPVRRWSWWDCLYYEQRSAGRAVVLDRGKFFRVKREDAAAINDFAAALEPSGLELPDALHREIEPSYNPRVAEERDDLLLMDKQFVRPIPGESQIEACDLFSEAGHLIHIKRRKGGSSGLSHLFAQAFVSSRLLKSQTEFADQMREKLGDFADRLADPPRAPDHPVVLAVILTAESKGEGAAALPFFSKVFLRQNVLAMQTMGYTIHFDEIPAPL